MNNHVALVISRRRDFQKACRKKVLPRCPIAKTWCLENGSSNHGFLVVGNKESRFRIIICTFEKSKYFLLRKLLPF